VVYNRDIAPIYRSASYSVVPIEGVLGVIEVKSKLTSNELKQAALKLHLIKAMPRGALNFYQSPECKRWKYGRWWSNPPISTYIVAFDSISLPVLADRLRDAEVGWPREECLDVAYVLWKGCLSDASDFPPDRTYLKALSDRDMVLGMAVEFITQFQRFGQPSFLPGAYLGSVGFGLSMSRFGTWNSDGSQGPP